MKSKFEKSLRAIRAHLKKVTDNQEKETLRKKLKTLKKMMHHSEIS